MHVELVAITQYLQGDKTPEGLLVRAGRLCYRSQDKGDPREFLRKRVQEGHLSLVEHVSFTFEITGISRACSHQLVRHRIASYSQESQRYVDMSDPKWVIPSAIGEDIAASSVMAGFLNQVRAAYRTLRGLGIRKEDARFVLPNAAATRIMVTMNCNELLHFFGVRITPQAQWEIREVALRMLDLAHSYVPSVFEVVWRNALEVYAQFMDAVAAVA